MKKLKALRIFWPPVAIRIIIRGAQVVAQFRAEQGREPTEREWREMANRVGREIFSDKP
jgi:hypothetical protein